LFLQRIIAIALLVERASSGIRDLSIESVVQQLGAHDWRVGARLTAESNLVRLGGLHHRHRADLDLVFVSQRIPPPSFIVVLLVATFLLTVWQARWSYFSWRRS